MNKIKVLHIVTSMNRGGLETFIMNVFRNIDRDKFQFDFLVHANSDLHYDYTDEIKILGGTIHRVPSVSNFFTYIYYLFNFLKKSDYNIVHIHAYTKALFPVLFAKYFGKKTIVHSHNTSFSGGLLYTICKSIVTYPVRFLGNFYLACGSEAGKWLFGKNIINRSNFSIVTNGIDTNTFTFNSQIRDSYQEQLGLKGKLVLGHVGRFGTQKNHTFLIDIFAEVHKQNSETALLLIGRGPLEEEIKNKVHNLGLSDVVHFLGVRTDIAELMNAMDIFVFPSLYEGLGIVLIEAQATGLPCLVSDTVPEEAKITTLCKFISLGNSNYWAKECLAKQAEQGDTSAEISKAGYSISSSVEKLQTVYCKLINNKDQD